MKQKTNLLKLLTVCTVALLTMATTAQAAEELTAKVVRLKGSARYSTGGNVWQPIKIGDTFKTGAIIQTAAGSIVDIVFAEATGPGRTASGGGLPSISSLTYSPTVQRDIVRVQPDSVLAIDRLTATKTGSDRVTETQLDLRSGRIIGSVNKVSAASTFEVKIPNGVAGIRGTLFSISALGVVSVLEGSVACAFSSPDGPKVVVVQAGFEFDITTGETRPIPADMRPSDFPRDVSPRTTVLADGTIVYVSPIKGEQSSPEEPPQTED